MIKKRLAKSMALMVACFSFLGASQSFANESNVPELRVTTSYNSTISDGKTITTGSVRSGQDIIGTNEVATMQMGELKCWIIDKSSSKVASNTRSYSSKGNYNMTYTYRPNDVQLKIQNPLGGKGSSISTSGKFHS